MSDKIPFPVLSAEEAAALIPHDALVGFSGFTPAGAAKAVPRALAARAKALHAAGQPWQIRVLTGASTGKSLDQALADADAISWRAPYQSSKGVRDLANKGGSDFVDMHLSHVSQQVLQGVYGKMDFAVIEATGITPDGRVYLTTSIGNNPTYLQYAEKVIIELNHYHSPRLREMADIVIVPPAPHRTPIAIMGPMTRIGVPYALVDPKKIAGIVHTNEPDEITPFAPAGEISKKIAGNVVNFLLEEMAAGRLPKEFLPLQSGVGDVANAVLECLGKNPDIPPFTMFTEVFQDACVDLMESGRLVGASSTALTVTPPQLQRMYANMDLFANRIVLRPMEISNNPGLARRLGIIAMNTAIEVDIYGHVNSTHVGGTQIMNGIGGSGDFERNGFLSFFMCPSFAKGGCISTIVPMCT
ncbi:MAG TPA: acetyl-CoA hydrolase/transferase C-terminal domain-containing protein, partial [Chthoniobacteraceae bacterium]|nr:acetyl-CoA hydrolase/transferase C-terminal domain-containing protein [Chthoniobacteraceae bacterium]